MGRVLYQKVVAFVGSDRNLVYDIRSVFLYCAGKSILRRRFSTTDSNGARTCSGTCVVFANGVEDISDNSYNLHDIKEIIHQIYFRIGSRYLGNKYDTADDESGVNSYY